jgi:hypothetical protein
VFESRVLRKIFGPKRDEVTEEWRRLHNEKLCDTYCSPSIRLIKSRIRWVGFVESVGIGEVRTGEVMMVKDHMRGQDVDGRNI